MESLKKSHLILFISLISLISIFLLSGCSFSGEYTLSNGADFLFAIMPDYKTEAGKNPLDDLLGLTDDEKTKVTYSVEDSAVISIDQAGVISSCSADDQEVTYVTASYGDETKKIKVVVAGDYDPEEYKTYDNLYIPYGITSVGDEYSGSSCTYVNIPDTVNDILEGTFKNCTNLTEVHLPSNITNLPNSIFYKCTSLKYVSLPDSLTTIGESAFRDCDSLESINIPDSVSSINDMAFYTCKKLSDVNLPSSLTFLGEKAFSGCESITSVVIPDGLTMINNDAFASCTSLSDLSLPNTLTSIGDRAFLNCMGLESLVLPNSLTSLCLDAFSGCINIKSMTLPITLPIDKSSFPSVASVTYFKLTGSGAGYNYDSENYINTPWYVSRNHKIKVDIEEGITSIGDYTFIYCYGLTEINLPNSLRTISHGAFRKCFNLESIVLPDSITEIGLHAFSLDYALKDITYSNNLVKVGNYAFYCCTSIKDVSLPDSVVYVGEAAYAGCNYIETINLGTSTKSNLKYIGKDAFAGFLFDCKEVNIYSTKIKYILGGAFGYVGDEKPENSIATLGIGSVIKVSNNKIKNLFVADKNYYADNTTIQVR